jgi:SAM-dependent methyltransferase
MAGNKVECIVCEKKFSKFLPYGYGATRENVLCPNCLSLERHRLIWYYLNHHTNLLSQPNHLLHIAPEQCFYKKFKSLPQLKYVTADLESPLAEVKMDIQAMPFADNTFDVVLCNHVLEHIPDDKKAMREILRVMKPNAWAILQVPMKAGAATTFEDATITDRKERALHFGQYDHLRLYGKDYGAVLQSQGFEVEKVDIQKQIGPELTNKYRFMEGEILYIGRKR